MAQSVRGGDSSVGVAPSQLRQAYGRFLLALLVFVVLLGGAYVLNETSGYGAASSFSLLIGVSLGVVFQRGRFCFFCITRDYIQERNSGGMFAVLSALAVGGVGYAVVFGAFLPNAMSGRLPPDAHIGPVSWALALAGFAFGVGMTLSGACISGHIYRLGEGYARAPLALIGALVGFGLGFLSWQTLYLNGISTAPVAWLPATFGYGGALAIHLALLTVLALVFMRRLPELRESAGGKITLQSIYETVFRKRWNPLLTGALVGLIGVAAYFRVEPLGVTAQLGTISRTAFTNAGWLGDRLNGLDTFAGCATIVTQAIIDNGWLIGGMVLGSFGVALIGNHFKPSGLTLKNGVTALLGGVLMGWGAMIALGCTVGVLLSGISAFAVSGWVFAAATFAGIWIALKLRLNF